jgi:hypothetical protein
LRLFRFYTRLTSRGAALTPALRGGAAVIRSRKSWVPVVTRDCASGFGIVGWYRAAAELTAGMI